MSNSEHLVYCKIIEPTTQLISQWFISRGDFMDPPLVKATQDLKQLCREENLALIFLHDGEDDVLSIEKDQRLIFSTVLNFKDCYLEDEGEENEQY